MCDEYNEKFGGAYTCDHWYVELGNLGAGNRAQHLSDDFCYLGDSSKTDPLMSTDADVDVADGCQDDASCEAALPSANFYGGVLEKRPFPTTPGGSDWSAAYENCVSETKKTHCENGGVYDNIPAKHKG